MVGAWFTRPAALAAPAHMVVSTLAPHRVDRSPRIGCRRVVSPIPESIARDVIELGRQFAARGWVPATSGNFSARITPETFAITISGRHKGELAPDDLMIVDLDGRTGRGGAAGDAPPDRRASNEAPLHAQLYRRDPAIGAVLHVHAVHATVLSRVERGSLRIDGWELQKAFPGEANPANFDNFAKAVEAFEATLITPNSRFDKFLTGDAVALNDKEKQGLRLFLDKGCAACHSGVNLGGNGYHPFGAAQKPSAE